jgi:hypothetical protein
MGAWADRSGMSVYTHLIRAKDDPTSTPNAQRAERDYLARWQKALKKDDIVPWMRRILDTLRERGPMTFQRLCVELVNRDADGCFETALDRALWKLVEYEEVQHTPGIPVLFRITRKLEDVTGDE